MVKLVAIYSELPFWLRQLKGGCIRETLIPLFPRADMWDYLCTHPIGQAGFVR